MPRGLLEHQMGHQPESPCSLPNPNSMQAPRLSCDGEETPNADRVPTSIVPADFSPFRALGPVLHPTTTS